MQVTISLLPASLSLVHIPRSRLPQLSHPILKQILQPNPIFFNITCNEVELTLFADDAILDDFEPISRRDRQKLRSRPISESARKPQKPRDVDPVEISYERWSVLQVDSHSDQLDNSGARVNEVSAPLAAAGISILYQSSYMSDFIFVKKSRLAEAMSLLATAGFEIFSYTNDESPISPTYPQEGQYSSHGFFHPPSPSNPKLPCDTTDPALRGIGSKPTGNPRTVQSFPKKKKPHSPTSAEVRLLPSDLACVGLSDELGADHWGLKVIKLVAFPELISSPGPLTLSYMSVPYTPKSRTSLFELPPPRNPSPISSSSSLSSGDEDDGYWSHSPQTSSPTFGPIPPSRSHSDTFQTSQSFRCKPTLPHLSGTRTSKGNHSNSPVQVPEPQIPFLSYTRTSEGLSLTADVHILSTLIPANERHMVNSSGELDDADNRLIDGTVPDGFSDEGDFTDRNILSCLQINLQRFGLDKYGLVNGFSQILRENGINHMYSSTFKTANILVDKRYARRAQTLLCNC